MALSKPKFLNWIKAALAVLFTKEEIEPVVYNEIAQFQQRCLQNISSQNGLPAGSICSSCTTESVVKCPTNRICNVNRRKCSYHRNVATQYRPTGCPKQICHEMKSEIQNAHRFYGPSYKNTDATQWCRNPWEIAKCFMPPDGYKDVMNAADTDFNGVISVILNYKGFEAKISDDLSKKNNIFDKGRDVGKAVRHSPNLEVEDADLIQFFTTLNSILTDPGFKSISKSQNNASQRLAKLQSDDLIIGKDVIRKVLEDVGKTIQEQIRNEMDEYKKKTEEQKLELIDIVNLKVKAIEDKGNISLNQLNDALKLSVDAFDVKVQKAVQDIEVVAKKETENAIKEIQKAAVKTGASTTMSQETYQKRKEELKEDLIEFYKWKHSTVNLSPLFEEKDTPLASFYIRPEMNVKTLSNMFKTGIKPNREIYLTADAGLGKTTFSKYLATSWSQAHCKPDEKDLPSFDKRDLDCMNDFDFLFLVLLRESNTSCSVDELISKLIVSNLDHSNSFTEDFLQELLSREKCLVILDGLDEWTHPNGQCERVPRSIPHRKVRKNCTVLTTTRPWKLGDLNLNSNELGKTVELTKLSRDSAETLIRRTLLKLKSPPHNMPIKIGDATLVKEIFDSRVADLAYVPLLLMYMICLRCEGFKIEHSKCELYVKIVELLLLRTTQKYGDLSQVLDLSSSNIPGCFAEHNKCKEYFPLLVSLGQLAYYTLSDETKENTLVFDGSVAEKYLAPEKMNFTLHSGILSQSTTKKLTSKINYVSFSHKTVQEFFAAIFISSRSDAQEIVLKQCRNVVQILDISKVCEFISQMNADLMCAISNDLMSVINEDEKTRDYRTRTGDPDMYNKPLYNIQNMFMSCLQEMPESENIQICLQDFFIDLVTDRSEQLQRLIKQNKTNIKSLYINSGFTSSSLLEIIDLLSLTDLSHIQKLHYECSNIKLNAEWTNDDRYLIRNLAQCQNLQYLCITGLYFSHRMLKTIFNFISGQKSMKELTLNAVFCKEHYKFCDNYKFCATKHNYLVDLSKHSTLKKLDLQALPFLQLNITTPSLVNVKLEWIKLDESSLLLSRDMVNIERVLLKHIEVSAGSLQNFIIVLENLPQSVTVKMTHIKPDTEYEGVRENIRRSQTFHVIHYWSGLELKTIKPSEKGPNKKTENIEK